MRASVWMYIPEPPDEPLGAQRAMIGFKAAPPASGRLYEIERITSMDGKTRHSVRLFCNWHLPHEIDKALSDALGHPEYASKHQGLKPPLKLRKKPIP